MGPDDLLYFADVCAAPGGFSEYVLWRRKTNSQGFCDAKGFGFTLRENDFKLHDFFAAPAEFFEPHYGGWTKLLRWLLFTVLQSYIHYTVNKYKAGKLFIIFFSFIW